MIDFDAIIKTFGPKAVANLNQSNSRDSDERAINAIRNRNVNNREAILKNWLRSYSVFQGIIDERREAITKVVLQWSDSLGESIELKSLDEICKAHAELRSRCEDTAGKHRRFISLASKAIWLRSPENVPIYDQYAQDALFFLCKLDTQPPAIGERQPDYERFARFWKDRYDRHEKALSEIAMNGYKYRARVFDVILWLIGRPGYTMAEKW